MKLSTFSNLLLAGVASSLFLSSGHAESERQRRPDPGSRTAHVSSRSHNDRNSNNNDRNRNFRDRDNRWSGNRDRDNRRNYSKPGHRYYGHRGYGSRYSGRYSYGYPYRSGCYGYSPYYYGYPGTSISVGVGSGYYATDYAGTYRRDDRPVYRGELAEENDSSLELSVQRKLARLGFYKGSIDGDIGPSTRRAISRFQEENDLDVTGRIDRELVEELDLD